MSLDFEFTCFVTENSVRSRFVSTLNMADENVFNREDEQDNKITIDTANETIDDHFGEKLECM